MKRVVVFLTLAAAVAACRGGADTQRNGSATQPGSAATNPVDPSGGPAHAPAITRPLLWRADKDGRTTYFLGTMHVGVDAQTQLPPVVWQTLSAARTFAMEANLDDPAVAAAIRPTGRSLRADLGEAYWKKLEDALGTNLARAYEFLPPLIPATALSLRGLPQGEAMDKTLAAHAAAAHKPIVYLEPATRQLALLQKWMDVRALKMMLDELPAGARRIHAMAAAYTDGDERRLLELSDEEKREALHHGYTETEYAKEMTDLLYDRNTSWLDALDQLHASGGGFVAVGALHLVGERSVLDLLAHRGYRITRIAAPPDPPPP